MQGLPTVEAETNQLMLSGEGKKVPLTSETIDGYMDYLRSLGRVWGTIDSYRCKMCRLIQFLPEHGKTIQQGTLLRWRDHLVEEGLSIASVNQFVVAANGYLEYMGAREFQVTDKLKQLNEIQPELTRSEYLRLLSAARSLGREQTYLLVKVFGNSDLPVQELTRLTVEAAQAGSLSISYSRTQEIIRFPKCICRELLDYASQREIQTGPIFLTRNGKVMDRTNVTRSIRRLCAAAQVPEEKANPRCLRKLYQATREGIERKIALLVEQAQDRLLEEEQMTVGWDV